MDETGAPVPSANESTVDLTSSQGSKEAASKLPAARPSDDLEQLLRHRGIGPLVVQRLREVGVRSISELQRQGIEPAVRAICVRSGHLAWRNRTTALADALGHVLRAPSTAGTAPK
jgi:hypothetical protein